MKQNGRKRVSTCGNSHQNLSDITNDHQIERARVKRRKTQGGEKDSDSPNISKTESWSIGAVGPDLLEDMGVGELSDETAKDCSQRNRNQKLSKPNTTSSDDPNASSGSNSNVNSVDKSNSENRVEPSKMEQNSSISDDFFIYRRAKAPVIQGEDRFSKLSDEMVLLIFKFLPKPTLAMTARVCKRWRRISLDEALWTRLDLGSRCILSGSIEHIFKRGPLILRLAQSEISDPVFPNGNPFTDKECKLQYLDLSMASISPEGMALLLSSCRWLRKLSLEHCVLNDECCAAIGENSSLEVLNLSACYGITESGLSSIVSGCSRLSSLNLAWTNLSKEAIEVFCISAPTSLQRLNISGCKKTMEDKHVEKLVKRCPELVELDLSDCTNLTDASLTSVCLLNKIEYAAFSRCYSITPAGYYLLASVTSLSYLDVFNLFQKPALSALQLKLPNVEINKFLFSSVARPTVGIRRTSIWGLRVRD